MVRLNHQSYIKMDQSWIGYYLAVGIDKCHAAIMVHVDETKQSRLHHNAIELDWLLFLLPM